MERSVGATVCDRLELLREEPSSVGVQVFGPTWVVLDSQSGELARACLLDDELLPTPAGRHEFVAAVTAIGQLRDPALVPQLFVGADAHGGAVLYEPVSGGVAFGELYDGTGSYELAVEVGRLARQLARALAALHQRGRVHGMLTAACVFVGPRGPSVYQYGLAPLCDRAVLMRRVRAFDLPGVAPEILAGGPFSPAADLYSWAVAVAQFASGARAPTAIAAVQTGQELPGVSPGLRAALQLCLSEEPGGRPQDAGDLLRRLDSVGLGDASGMIPLEQVVPPTPPPLPPPPLLPAQIVPSTSPPAARPATLPPRPPAPKDRPGTLPPATNGMSLPVTSFEEMLMTGDRQRRPAPTPAPSIPTANAPSVSAPASSTSSAPASRSVTELTPEDLMHESGAWTKSGTPTGKSSTALRRVHVLTDPVRREGSDPAGLAPIAPASITPDKPSGELLIGGTREELEAVSRATTVKLDPTDAAAAVKAATLAHANSAPMKAAASVTTPSPGAAAVVPADDGGIAVPAERIGSGPGDSARRRTAAAVVAATDRRAEPQDWGKIPTAKHATVPAPAALPAPTGALAVRKPPLPLIFAAVGLLLLLILIFSR